MSNLPSIQDIARDTREKLPYFFSPDSLRFFGQTMDDFRVVRSSSGQIYIYAKAKGLHHKSWTLRKFVDGNLEEALDYQYLVGVSESTLLEWIDRDFEEEQDDDDL